ncbi:hypothetical protein RND71_033228 [Anisodus tanguticus]|uniref:W2 domain-containing protein n=1 Tax=Anisodus tanguticus TaxID=243964 RepID=A0AAE1R7C3_9SOLA|nr:hypothetical protein RND71_033228 [Anisodus tanguticus]
MFIKQSKPSPITRQSRLGIDELIMAIDPETKQLYYEDDGDDLRGYLSLDKAMLTDSNTFSMSLYNDRHDCYIDICSPEVLSFFTDNFDYQHLRRDFVKGLLDNDIMSCKVFTHEIHSSYAAIIDNYRSYDTVSKDIIQLWTYPLVPDVQFLENSASTKLERQGMYRAPEVKQSHSAKIGPFTVIGTGTSNGDNTYISNSIIGEGCTIGSNVTIEGLFIWHNVMIEDDCKLKHSIACDSVTMKSETALEPGVVLSFNVMVSLLQQPMNHDSSDEELEYYADNSSGITEVPYISEVGDGGVGFIWSASEEEWRHSVAPIPVDKLMQIINDEADITNEDDDAILSPSGELRPDNSNEDAEGIRDDNAIIFEEEVEATFGRAVVENVKEDYIILEVNGLRLSNNMTSADCAGALFYSVMKLALDTPHIELVDVVAKAIRVRKKLLKYYLSSIDEEIEIVELLYNDIIQEEAIFVWASEKEGAEESDKVFVKQSEQFIQGLREAFEEED